MHENTYKEPLSMVGEKAEIKHTLCRYVSEFLGKSKLITTFTS
jgi:hypothetical protein